MVQGVLYSAIEQSQMELHSETFLFKKSKKKIFNFTPVNYRLPFSIVLPTLLQVSYSFVNSSEVQYENSFDLDNNLHSTQKP